MHDGGISVKYTVGVDFGTLSARAVVICVENGEVLSEGEHRYALWENRLPAGTAVPPDMVLADPREYQAALIGSVRKAVAASGAAAEDVIGIAVDATSLTLVATDESGEAMCLKPEWSQDPNAWIKLWKSHSAQKQAERIEAAAREKRHPLLAQCGGRISCEWAYPKMLETYEQSPELFHKTGRFWDLCDWLTFLLCGEVTRNAGSWCYKFHFDGKSLPDENFWDQVRTGFGTGLQGKLEGRVILWGEQAGRLLPSMAEKMGLLPGIAVGGGSLDGHVAMAALGLQHSGDAMLTIGTSTVCGVLAERMKPVRGVCGAGIDAMIPGKCGYDSGQCSVGDTFQWFVENLTPETYFRLARERGISVYDHLSQLAFAHPPRLKDPLALDWWNGNRCTRGDLQLRGAVQGLSLSTRTEDLYRALAESTAFGIRNIIENFAKQGVPVSRVRVCGGIARKDPALMQCYADVLEMPMEVSSRSNVAAVGAAILASVAAGCYPSLQEAMNAQTEKRFAVYQPRREYSAVYSARYQAYQEMDHFFGGDIPRDSYKQQQ